PHTVTALFHDTDGNFFNTGGSLSGGQAITAGSTATAVASSADPSVAGQDVTFTATVSPVSPAAGTPHGTVDFVVDGTTAAAGVTLVGGQATFHTSTLSVSGSPHAVTVNFHDTDGSYADSSGALAGGQAVNRAGTTVAVASSQDPSVFGQDVTFT